MATEEYAFAGDAGDWQSWSAHSSGRKGGTNGASDPWIYFRSHLNSSYNCYTAFKIQVPDSYDDLNVDSVKVSAVPNTGGEFDGYWTVEHDPDGTDFSNANPVGSTRYGRSSNRSWRVGPRSGFIGYQSRCCAQHGYTDDLRVCTRQCHSRPHHNRLSGSVHLVPRQQRKQRPCSGFDLEPEDRCRVQPSCRSRCCS